MTVECPCPPLSVFHFIIQPREGVRLQTEVMEDNDLRAPVWFAGKVIILLETVYADFFSHLTVATLIRKVYDGHATNRLVW